MLTTYARARIREKNPKNFSRARKRLRELECIISSRHGSVPDTDDADLYLTPVANCFYVIAFGLDRSASVDKVLDLFLLWCELRAPHVGVDQATEIVRRVCAGPPELIDDDTVGRDIRLPYEERLRHDARTIGSFDADKATRKKLAKARKRKRDRVNAAAKRRASGATPRAVYEAKSLSKTQPWIAEGISRSTYDRRRKKEMAASKGQSIAVDESPSLHNVDESASSHLLSSIDRRRTFVTEAPVAADISITPQAVISGAPEAPLRLAPIVDLVLEGQIVDGGVARAPPPDQSSWQGKVIDQDGIEFNPPPPYQRRSAPKTWMDAAFEGYNGGRS